MNNIRRLILDEKIINKILQKKVDSKNFFALMLKIIIIIIVMYVIFNFIFGFFRLKDNSMNPYISEGSLMLYYRLDNEYTIGDVIVFEKDSKEYALRIVAREGQIIDINEEGELLIDGYPDESKKVLFETIFPENSDIQFPYKVEQNCFFVVGDYRVQSNDSRNFGSISKDCIKGKVISIIKTRNI